MRLPQLRLLTHRQTLQFSIDVWMWDDDVKLHVDYSYFNGWQVIVGWVNELWQISQVWSSA
jgi:hypothetical protein